MSSHKINISVVSYLNARPFVYGLEEKLDTNTFILSKDIPSVCSEKLINNSVDIGLIPVATIPKLAESHIITSYGIASFGKVESVILVSKVPLKEIQQITLDMESRTSVLLAKILAKELWEIHPEWILEKRNSDSDNLDQAEAAVIIGDRALKYKSKFSFVYDLSEGWKELTGLPFVFAVWVSNKKIRPEFIQDIENALEYGVGKIDVILQTVKSEHSALDVNTYLKERIKYKIGEEEKKGMNLFLEKIRAIA